MLIKQNGFNLLLPTKLPSLFALNGPEVFLAELFKQQFKQAWLKNNNETNNPIEFQRIDIVQTQDWQQVTSAFGNYSLFSSLTVLDVVYDKKNLDKEGKSVIQEYLDRDDLSCLLFLHFPQLSNANLKFLADDPRAAQTAVKIPDKTLVERWISDELRTSYKQFPITLPRLIYQYTQGNLLACSQVLQKIKLAEDNSENLTEKVVLEQLENQCNYQLYELSDTCLTGDTGKALLVFRYALENRYERTLILWVLAQEIRLLIQLNELKSQQNNNWQAAIKQLKIWPSRAHFYQNALQRLDQITLTALLSWCSKLDQLIKTSQTNQIDSAFELLIVSLCLGKEMNPLG